MSDLDPRIARLPRTTPASQHGQARGRSVPDDPARQERSAPGHGDMASLSSAGRAALDRDLAPDGAGLTADEALAAAANAAESSVSIAGAAHTALVMRGARLLR